MEILAVGNGNILFLIIGVAVGALIGWGMPQPAFIKRIFGG